MNAKESQGVAAGHNKQVLKHHAKGNDATRANSDLDMDDNDDMEIKKKKNYKQNGK